MLLRERLVWVHPETPSPLAGEGFDRELSRTVGVRGSKTEHFNILNHYHPHPTLLRRRLCRNSSCPRRRAFRDLNLE